MSRAFEDGQCMNMSDIEKDIKIAELTVEARVWKEAFGLLADQVEVTHKTTTVQHLRAV